MPLLDTVAWRLATAVHTGSDGAGKGEETLRANSNESEGRRWSGRRGSPAQVARTRRWSFGTGSWGSGPPAADLAAGRPSAGIVHADRAAEVSRLAERASTIGQQMFVPTPRRPLPLARYPTVLGVIDPWRPTAPDSVTPVPPHSRQGP